MLRLCLILFVFGAYQSIFIQAEMVIVYEDIMIPHADKEYIIVHDTYLTDDNGLSLNISIVKILPEDVQCHVYMLGSSMGKYVVPCGVDFDMDMCEMLDEPIILGRLLAIFGFKKEECPPLPGLYGSEGFLVPVDKFPDDFPANQYLFVLDISSADELIVSVQVSLTVQ